MRTLPSLVVALAAAAAPVVFTAPASAQSAPTTPTKLERFLKIRTPGAPAFAPDGTLYVRDWPDGIFQIYKVQGKEAKPGVKTTKLTHFPDGAGGFSISPDGKHILVLAAVGGNENTQIYAIDESAKEGVRPLVQNPRVQHGVNLWTRDAAGFVYTANDTPRAGGQELIDFHIYRYDMASGKPTKLLAKEGSWSASDISADGSRLLVGEYRSSSDSTIQELDVKSGKLTDLTAAEGSTVSAEWVGYTPGDAAALFTGDAEGGLRRLFLKDLKSGQVTKPISELEPFEIDSAGMNHEKTLLAVVTNEDGYGVLHLYRLPGFESVALPETEKGVVFVNEIRGNRIVWTLSNARTPGVSFAYDVPDTGAGKAVQVTFADTQGLELSGFPLPELVKYRSFDGMEIPAFVFLPPGYEKGKPIPFIVNYHGGPEGQSRPSFSALIQYLLSEGFGVMQPNVRGSSGYGRDFIMMDDYKGRWRSVKDGVDAAEWLVANGYGEAGKMATYGGSYGGYMSLACLVEDANRTIEAGTKHRARPALFGAGVNVVGIANMKTFLEKTSGYRRKLREVEYGPLTDSEFLLSVSPITQIDKIRVPLFIAHGFNDPRVPVEEAMQIATALKDKGLSPQLFIAPDEGHGFAKLDNRLYFTQRMAAFLKETIAK